MCTVYEESVSNSLFSALNRFYSISKASITAFLIRTNSTPLISATIPLRFQHLKGTYKFKTGAFGSKSSPAAMSAAKQFVQEKVNNNAVVVFSKTYCPYCTMAKDVLNSVNAKYSVVELDTMDDGADIQNALQELTGQRTVPNVFVGKKSIGGGSETKALHQQGKLVPLLQSNGAL